MHDISIPGQRLNWILTFLISAITDVNIPILLPLKNKYTFNTSTVGVQSLVFNEFNLTFQQEIIGFSLWPYGKTPTLANTDASCHLAFENLGSPSTFSSSSVYVSWNHLCATLHWDVHEKWGTNRLQLLSWCMHLILS